MQEWDLPLKINICLCQHWQHWSLWRCST